MLRETKHAAAAACACQFGMNFMVHAGSNDIVNFVRTYAKLL
jgi:hypothetical protein